VSLFGPLFLFLPSSLFINAISQSFILRLSSHPADGDPRSPGVQGLPSRPPRLIAIPAQQHLLEGLAENLIEDRVEDRIHHGAGVAEPGDQVEDLVVDSTLAVGTEGRHQVQHEERRPQYHEREEYHAQHLRRLLLQPNDPAVARTVARDDAAVTRMMTADLACVSDQIRRRRIALLQSQTRARRAIVRPHRRRAPQRHRSRVHGQYGPRVPCKDSKCSI